MMNSYSAPVAAALDIGSNTIKMLVVEKTPQGMKQLAERTFETRISKGISQNQPRLTEESMGRALDSIAILLREIQCFEPDYTRIVATSAVRDAHNREDFQQRVLEKTGQPIDVISGAEEARLIGRGVLTDPALFDQSEIVIFDMGGGSVECIHLREKQLMTAESFPLGGVRLVEQFVADPSLPLKEEEKRKVRETVLKEVGKINLLIEQPENALVVGAGGTYVTSRAIIAHRQGKDLSQSSPYLTLGDLRAVFDEVAGYPLEQRLKVPKLPPNRADVFPVTLLALITLGEWAGIRRFYHCYHSLRYGVVDELLENH